MAEVQESSQWVVEGSTGLKFFGPTTLAAATRWVEAAEQRIRAYDVTFDHKWLRKNTTYGYLLRRVRVRTTTEVIQ